MTNNIFLYICYLIFLFIYFIMLKTILIQKIPNDIIINCIIPFLYEPQPKKLLEDIKNFYITFLKLEEFYSFEYNYYIMFYDLQNFFLYGEENVSITNQFYYIFKRHFIFQNLQYIIISNYVYNKFNKKKDIKPKNNSKFLWGLLTNDERINFIKNYIDYN